MIVEPVPSGNEAYLRFAELWRKAMTSIGRYEVYQLPEYWWRLAKEAGFNITLKKIIRWNSYVPSEVLMNMGEETVKEWKELGVHKEIIEEFKEFLKEKPKMKWSDIAVIVASRA
ncbi:hypothetical protein [Thermococcus chitonophagus]|nr:hypothetical protein [Thermococcus chitonophagus]